MAADRDHDVIEAIARMLRNLGCPNPDAAALEVNVAYRARYHMKPKTSDDWRHGGPGLPTQGSEAATLLGEYRARQEAGHG